MITTRQFLRKAYIASLLREPTPQETGRQRASLNTSWAVGGSALLNDAKAKFKALFLSSAYIARSTDNAHFISDVYGAYFDRPPTGSEVTTQTTYLGGHTRTQMLDAVGALSEFSTRVATVVPVGPFPTADRGGSTALKILDLPPNHDDAILTHDYPDGGQSVDLVADISSREWEVNYDGLDDIEALVYDEHREDARGQGWGFDFVDRAGNVWTGTKYAKGGFTADHTKTWIQARKARLIWRP